jgi:decaprenyl-phosphate phosphoribosyltransferase
MRPRQWVKNALVFIAPAASGTLLHRHVLAVATVAFIAFSAIASSIYLLNDVRDADDDRQHPTKRFRAIAAGELSRSAALALAVVLLVSGLTLPLVVVRPMGLYLVLGLYMAQAVSYILGIKRIPIIEMAFVASGFLLRAYAGAAATHIPVSEWFLVVISFGALFLVIGKRSAELRHVGEANRAVLKEYTLEFLHSSLTMTATVVVTAYCLWALDTSSTGLSSLRHDVLPVRLSVAPVVLAVLFIIRGAESPEGEAPEDLVLKNRVVQVLVVLWALLLGWAVYG